MHAERSHPENDQQLQGFTAICRIIVLTNAELARMVDTSDAWITERTGIKERRILKGEGLGTSHMGAEAVRGLLERTGTKPTTSIF